MSRTHSMTAADYAAHRALEQLVPALDPPEGALPDAEQLVALAEGRLTGQDADALRSAIAQSPAARVELRALYPQTYERLFEAERVEIGAEVIPFHRRPAVWAAVIAAAAAVFVFVLRPLGPPAHGLAELAPTAGERVRSAQGRDDYLLRPGKTVDLTADLGRAGLLDRLRGGTPWGAFVRIDADGAEVLCTHLDPRCRSSETTMALRQVVSGPAASTIRFGVITANQPVDLSSVKGPVEGAEARIDAAVDQAGGALRWLPTVVIDRP